MKRIPGYHPTWQCQLKLDEFEEGIGQPIRSWLREQAGKGYGVMPLADTVGISYRQMCALLEHHGIKTTGSYRPVHKDGLSVRAYVRSRGGDRAMEDRVRNRIKAGLPIHEAWASAQHPQQGIAIRRESVADRRR